MNNCLQTGNTIQRGDVIIQVQQLTGKPGQINPSIQPKNSDIKHKHHSNLWFRLDQELCRIGVQVTHLGLSCQCQSPQSLSTSERDPSAQSSPDVTMATSETIGRFTNGCATGSL